jgi:hypothetical protein
MTYTLARFDSSWGFYPWGQLSTVVYAAPVDIEAELHDRIVDTCQIIRSADPRWDASSRALNYIEEILIAYYEYKLS